MAGADLTPEQVLHAAATLYSRGERDQVLDLCLRLLRTPIGSTAWELAALCLADRGRWADLLVFFDQTEAIGFATAPTVRQWAHSLQKRGWIPLLDRLSDNLPDTHVAWLLAIYYGASARLVAGEREAALQGFDRFRRHAKRFMGSIPFAADPSFNVIFRQGTTVLPAEATRRRLAAAAGLTPVIQDFRLVVPGNPGGDGPVLMAAADAAYTARFAPALVESLDAPGRVLHLHVVNPTPGSEATVADIGAGLKYLQLEVSFGTDRTYANATAFSCARFFALPHVLTRHGRTVLTLDVDLTATPALPVLEQAAMAGGFDFACFQMGRNDPASLYSACVMGFAPGPGTDLFLAQIGRFVLPRLAMPMNFNWMLDQAALISVINMLELDDAAFRFRDLNGLTGGRELTEFVTPPADEMEKQNMKRRVNGVTPDMIDAEGWVRYDWNPD
jgi:hypothetical protein